MNNKLSPEQLAARYDLLCRATQPIPQADDPYPVAADLDQLQTLINRDLLELARRGSPDHFAELYLDFGRELERFREFCAFPALAQKVVVGFGGAFSVGKSSLINALLGQRLLVAEVDYTTSLPSYLLHGEEDAIFALNLNSQRIRLSLDEFRSLTHDEMTLYGSAIGGLLRAAFITRADFPWPNLALVDTPGYSKPEQNSYSARTDENLARAQLNAAQAIVWLISAKAGGITEDDLNFLAALNRAIPLLVVVSRADAQPAADIRDIVDGIRRTLAERDLPVIDVIPVSSRNKTEYPLDPVLGHLRNWSQQNRQLRFAHNFKALFTQYARSIETELRAANWRLNRFNRILTLIDDTDIRADTGELKAETDNRIRQLKTQAAALHDLRSRFFSDLKGVGDKVGIALPEPDDIELLDAGRSNLLDLLIETRQQRGGQAPDVPLPLQALIQPDACGNQLSLLRLQNTDTARYILTDLQTHAAAVAKLRQLLRQPNQRLLDALAGLIIMKLGETA
ncbi:MAG: dynamin family protein [Methylococcales bacterium]|nr:dynamin family protein [Methylococcales bacterium]